MFRAGCLGLAELGFPPWFVIGPSFRWPNNLLTFEPGWKVPPFLKEGLMEPFKNRMVPGKTFGIPVPNKKGKFRLPLQDEVAHDSCGNPASSRTLNSLPSPTSWRGEGDEVPDTKECPASWMNRRRL